MQNHFLKVDNIHTLAIYTAGNPQGLPVFYLHGGPGAGCDLKHFDNFDLERCFVVLHDQRGCGRSTPTGCLENNTTWDLVADIEKIREHFKFEKILLYGGSWGSTLALAYAEAHAEKALGLVLRSICLARQADHRWLYEFGANQLFPAAWQKFIQGAGNDKNTSLLKTYYEKILSDDSKIVENAARDWNAWAAACLQLPMLENLPEDQNTKNYLINMTRIETHYFSHDAFLRENQLLEDLHKIKSLKAFIVHGAKDYLCPVANAFTLHQAWLGSELTILPEAGHLSAAPGMHEALQAGVRYFYD